MTDAHAVSYYAAPGRETATQAGPIESWNIPTDNIAGPIGSAFSGSEAGLGTNGGSFEGLSEMPPSDVVNSGRGPIPPGTGVIPTI